MSPSTHSGLEAEPQGNAMLSVRVTAAGAVFVACLGLLTAPARACDDRFIKKCEKAAAAAFTVDEAAAQPGGKRAGAKRVRVVASRHAPHSRLIRRTRAPRFASRNAQRALLASGGERAAALLPDTPMTRRFRGFIDPQPISQNAFEALRKPHAVALDFDAAAIVPPVEAAEAGAAQPESTAPATPVGNVTTTPKQDKLAIKPAAPMELASAESRPVTLPDLAPVKPVVKPALIEQAAMTAPIIVTESPAPSDQKPNKFSFHGLVLALCGALGAASALRFIVGA